MSDMAAFAGVSERALYWKQPKLVAKCHWIFFCG
jgi:hypothetical protein